MWKVCLCTRNKGQSVVHQCADSAAGSAYCSHGTLCTYRGFRAGTQAGRQERGSFIIYVPAGA